MREAFIKELGEFLDYLTTLGIVMRAEVKRNFGMDYKTVDNIRLGERDVSDATLVKMPYILAYCIAEYKKKLEAEEQGLERSKKLRDFPTVVEKFKSIYGHHATFCLSLVDRGYDLPRIVREGTM